MSGRGRPYGPPGLAGGMSLAFSLWQMSPSGPEAGQGIFLGTCVWQWRIFCGPGLAKACLQRAKGMSRLARLWRRHVPLGRGVSDGMSSSASG